MLSGNPLAMSAGIAALDLLITPGTWERLEKASADLTSGIGATAKAAGIPIQQTRVGMMSTTFFSEFPRQGIGARLHRHIKSDMEGSSVPCLKAVSILPHRRSRLVSCLLCIPMRLFRPQ